MDSYIYIYVPHKALIVNGNQSFCPSNPYVTTALNSGIGHEGLASHINMNTSQGF